MISISTDLTQATTMLSELAARAKGRRTMLAKAGRMMLDEELPADFADGGNPRWKSPLLWDGKALNDSGKLRKSFAYAADDERLAVYTTSPYGYVHNRPSDDIYSHKPTKAGIKWIAIPNPDVLSRAQARNSKPRDWGLRFAPGRNSDKAFLMKDGLVYYFLKKQVSIPGRRFLFWKTDFLHRVADTWAVFLETGSFRDGTRSAGASGGSR